MDYKKPTICPEYVRPGNRCDFILKLEELIEKGIEEAKKTRERHHEVFCAYSNHVACANFQIITEERKNKK